MLVSKTNSMVLIDLSQDDKLYKQLEDFVTTIIKSLENLEKEFTEYIDVTNKRIQILEEKVHRMESLADVSGKGLLKAIESSPNADKVKGLAHLTAPTIEQPAKEEVKVTPPVEAPIAEPKVERPPSLVPIPPSEQKTDETPATSIPTSITPPVPKPPSFKPVTAEEPQAIDESIAPKPHETRIPEVPKPPDDKEDDKKPKKEDEDKDELMSALKIIDSL